MNELLNKIAVCVERGKVNVKSPYPPDLKGQEGVDELTKAALAEGVSARTAGSYISSAETGGSRKLPLFTALKV